MRRREGHGPAAQAKNAAKADGKSNAKSDIKARSAALKVTWPNCKAQMLTHAQLVTHYEAKHPKETCPPPPE